MTSHPCAVRLLLPEALSGRLDPAEEKRVMAHLSTCATCQDAADEIEVSLVSLAMLRVAHDEQDQPGFLGVGPATTELAPSTPAEVVRRMRRIPGSSTAWISGIAAAVMLVLAGVGVGYRLLPPRDDVKYSAAVPLAPPSGAANRSARGSIAVGAVGQAMEVRLLASALPTAGWYECVWISAGQTRSAGSFRAPDGKADVELRVAAPQGSTGWDVQIVAHSGATSQVVLEGRAGDPS